jgi:CHASE2 domain-containing sensor protein
MLITALRALSQRFVIAIANLFVLITAFSAFWLWYQTMPDPTVPQLVGLTLYGLLILALNRLVLLRRI